MKFLSVFAVLCLVAYSTQSPLFEGCNEQDIKHFKQDLCTYVECQHFSNGTHKYNRVQSHACPFVRCKKGQKYKGRTPGHKTAVYPHCCATPICE